MAGYFYYGEDDFLVDQAVKAVLAQHPGAQKKVFQESFSLSDLRSQLSSLSLFGDQSIFVIRNPSFLLKVPSDKDAEHLSALVAHFTEDTSHQDHLIVYCHKAVDKRKKWVKTFISQLESKEFSKFKDWETAQIKEWVKGHLKEKQVQADADVISMLVDLGGTDLRYIDSEINKCLAFKGEASLLTLKDIQDVCSHASPSLYKLNEAVQARSKKEALSALELLLNDGEDPIKLFAIVSSNLRFFYHVLALHEQGASFQVIGEKTGKNPFFIKRLLPEISRRYSASELFRLFDVMCDTDLDVKTGKVSARRAVESLVMSMSSVR